MKEKSCGTIIINDNKVLLIKQKKGHLSFPKGHMEAFETEIKTALRETKEETNLDVLIDESKRFSLKFIMENGIEKENVFFIAKPITFEVQIQESEVIEYFWILKEEVIDVLEFDNIKELWKEILPFI